MREEKNSFCLLGLFFSSKMLLFYKYDLIVPSVLIKYITMACHVEIKQAAKRVNSSHFKHLDMLHLILPFWLVLFNHVFMVNYDMEASKFFRRIPCKSHRKSHLLFVQWKLIIRKECFYEWVKDTCNFSGTHQHNGNIYMVATMGLYSPSSTWLVWGLP